MRFLRPTKIGRVARYPPQHIRSLRPLRCHPTRLGEAPRARLVLDPEEGRRARRPANATAEAALHGMKRRNACGAVARRLDLIESKER